MLKYHANFSSHPFYVADIIVEMNAINDDTPLLMFFQVIDAADGGRFT